MWLIATWSYCTSSKRGKLEVLFIIVVSNSEFDFLSFFPLHLATFHRMNKKMDKKKKEEHLKKLKEEYNIKDDD